MTRLLVVPMVGLTAACSGLTDAAVDLTRCIGNGARALSQSLQTASEIVCPVRAHRSVTAILTPRSGLPSDSAMAALRQMGVPEEALYYSGPDVPSRGTLVGLGPVNVYDGHYMDNRKYSTSSAFGADVRIRSLMAKTGDQFTVLLSREAGGVVEVVGLR